MIRRKKPMPPRTTRLRPRARPAAPKRRKPSEFARIYGSKARVEWVKALPCIVPGCPYPSENAHIETDGTSRKAGYDKIVPACHGHNRMMDSAIGWGRKTFQRIFKVNLEAEAARIEARWQARTAERKAS